jgi:hypothetical protein
MFLLGISTASAMIMLHGSVAAGGIVQVQQ